MSPPEHDHAPALESATHLRGKQAAVISPQEARAGSLPKGTGVIPHAQSMTLKHLEAPGPGIPRPESALERSGTSWQCYRFGIQRKALQTLGPTSSSTMALPHARTINFPWDQGFIREVLLALESVSPVTRSSYPYRVRLALLRRM